MKILYSDNNIIVCIKPVGIDSEKGMPEELKKDFSGEIYTLHRLDLNVGGVMVYARNKKTAADFSRMIQNGELIKEYIAEVYGTPPDKGDWTDLLWKDSRKNKVYAVDRERKGVKKARLEFERLNAAERSQVRVRLHTGRSHQIRVQFASRGFPLVGDGKYGAKDNIKSPMLWSYRLTFSYKGETRSFEVLPEWYYIKRLV
ncbi:MAG: RNA pseudouridine synthase [Ruminococcaceae bacterium]|nr:RNA pseudouridine synthase [Oscillospiraceae bacterium]